MTASLSPRLRRDKFELARQLRVLLVLTFVRVSAHLLFTFGFLEHFVRLDNMNGFSVAQLTKFPDLLARRMDGV